MATARGSCREKDACGTQCLGAMALDAAQSARKLQAASQPAAAPKAHPRSSQEGTSTSKVSFKHSHVPVPGLTQEEGKSVSRTA